MALARMPMASLATKTSQSLLAATITQTLQPLSTLRSTIASFPVSTSISIPAISITVPGILSDIWNGILNAVPKKKTSHMKKRHRQLAGKALKDVNAVNTCPGCGKPKRAHFLCPYCVAEIKQSWKEAAKEAVK